MKRKEVITIRQDYNYEKYAFIIGIIPIIWIALLIAPYTSGELVNIVKNYSSIFENPFKIEIVNNSLKTIIVLLGIYAICISLYYSQKKHFRSKEEHGSAKWGNVHQINKKYMQLPQSENKILTQNVKLGLDGKKHRRNLNVMVVGGSGTGKTRFYCKPNIMQCNTSFVVLDPKGENLRDTGNLLKAKVMKLKF